MKGEARDHCGLGYGKEPVLSRKEICRIDKGSQEIDRRRYMEKDFAHALLYTLAG